jgi:hypothetical protein
MLNKFISWAGIIVFSLMLIAPASAFASASTPAQISSTFDKSPMVSIKTLQSFENSTHLANIKAAKADYQTAIKAAKAALASARLSAKNGPKANLSASLKTAQTNYKNALLSATAALKSATTTENARHKTALAASKTAASSAISAKPTIQTTGTITVVVQDGNGKPFGHPADYDILSGTKTTTVAYGSLTGDVTETSVPVGIYTLAVRNVTVDGVLYNGYASPLTFDNIANSGDTVSYRVDYMAPGTVSLQVTNFDPISDIKVTLTGPNGWTPQDVSDTNTHTFTNAPAGLYGLIVTPVPPDKSHTHITFLGEAYDENNMPTPFDSKCHGQVFLGSGKIENMIVQILGMPYSKPCDYTPQ